MEAEKYGPLQEIQLQLSDSAESLRQTNRTLLQQLQRDQDNFKSEFLSGLLFSQPAHVPKRQMNTAPDINEDEQAMRDILRVPEILRENYNDTVKEVNTSKHRKHAKEKLLQRKKKARSKSPVHKKNLLTSVENSKSSKTEDPRIKSILKQRKVIDDNVKVTSKYQHSPVTTPKTSRRGHRDLTFSYSDVDSDSEDEEKFRQSLMEKYNSKVSVSKRNSTNQETKTQGQIPDVKELMSRHLLLDAGNDRQHASVIKDIEKRPRNTLFDINAEETSCTHLDKTAKTSDYKRRLGEPQQSRIRQAEVTPDGRTLLGYDWIACILENADIGDTPNSLIMEVAEFRKSHPDECVGKETYFDKGVYTARPISPQIQDPGHTCIHGYVINDRLFTQPKHVSENGRSICPICLIERQPPTENYPGFVRVSIPKSMMNEGYSITPRTRSSVESSDSCALREHCLAGWQHAMPATMPSVKTLDIKDSIIQKQSTTPGEAESMASALSRLGRLVDFGEEVKHVKRSHLLIDASDALRRYEFQTSLRQALPATIPLHTKTLDPKVKVKA